MKANHGAPRPDWSLLTPRGWALLYIADHPGCTKKELVDAMNIGERRGTAILGELVSHGAVRGTNGDGRRLHYEIDPRASIEISGGERRRLRPILGRVVA
jgi:hypothetical protein